MAINLKKLFIPRKTQNPIQQPTYNTDMLAIENFINNLTTGGGGIQQLLAGTGIRLTPSTGLGPIETITATGTASLTWALYTATIQKTQGVRQRTTHLILDWGGTGGGASFTHSFGRNAGTTGYNPITGTFHNSTATTPASYTFTNTTATKVLIIGSQAKSWSMVWARRTTGGWVTVSPGGAMGLSTEIVSWAPTANQSEPGTGTTHMPIFAGYREIGIHETLAHATSFNMTSPIVKARFPNNITPATPLFNLTNLNLRTTGFNPYFSGSTSFLVLKA